MAIDPNILNVLLGVAANGLTTIVSQLFKTLTGPFSRKPIQEKETLNLILAKAQEKLSDGLVWNEPPRIEEVCLFLTSPEVESIVRQIYSTKLAGSSTDLDLLQKGFIALYVNNFGPEDINTDDKPKSLFKALLMVCEIALDISIAKGSLIAHEAKSNLRYQLLKDEISAIKKNVDFLRANQELNIKAVQAFETRYRDQIQLRHGRITPPSFYDARKVPIESIYVPPDFYMGKPSFYIKVESQKIEPVTLKTADFYKYLESYTVEEEVNPSIYLDDAIPWKVLGKSVDLKLAMPSGITEIEHLLPAGYLYHSGTLKKGLKEVLSSLYRAVILGNPGGGKSTFVNKICHDLAKYYNERRFASSLLTPIPVILREYGAEKKESGCSILQFIELTSNSRYQLSPPKGAFEFMLLNGRVVIIFDGLDELLDTHYRQEIRDDIESFCNLYPSVPVIVTSREVGYNQAPLDHDLFETLRLAPFSEEQVQEYVDKWFAVGTELAPVRQKQKTASFLSESQIVSDLRSNPLMLGLMCNIYRGENYIPRNRPDVYRKCAEMLFERWDSSREIPVSFHFEDDIRPVMAYLAFWIYEGINLREGVIESELIAKTTDYLLSHRFEDPDQAERAARSFIDFCRGRAWIFTEVGTDQNGEGIYQFTHRTFLEYFTALYLVRTNETTDGLVSTLLPKIAKQEWDVVAQLAFQIKSRSSEGAKDRLLSLLLRETGDANQVDKQNLLYFAARCLEFIEPNPRVIKDIVLQCLDWCIEQSVYLRIPDQKRENSLAHVGAKSKSIEQQLVSSLLTPSEQNLSIVAENVKSRIIDYVNAQSEGHALAALEIGLNLIATLSNKQSGKTLELNTLCNKIANELLRECRERIRELSQKNQALCVEAYEYGIVSLTEVVKWHNLQSLFRETHLRVFSGLRSHPVAIRLLEAANEFVYSSDARRLLPKYISDIEELGNLCLSISLPSVNGRSTYFHYNQISRILVQEVECTEETITLKADTIFGLFALLAIFLELEESKTSHKKRSSRKYPQITSTAIRESVEQSKHNYLKPIRDALVSRFQRKAKTRIITGMDEAGLTSQQKQFILQWIERKISFRRS